MRLRVVAPEAAQVVSLHKDCGTDAGAVVQTEALNIKYRSVHYTPLKAQLSTGNDIVL